MHAMKKNAYLYPEYKAFLNTIYQAIKQRQYLNDEGMILIGDVLFATHEDRKAYETDWDENEIYMIEESIQPLISNLELQNYLLFKCVCN